MFDKADLPAQDKEKARASLNMDNARDSLSSEENDRKVNGTVCSKIEPDISR